jgi:hypothetical protein
MIFIPVRSATALCLGLDVDAIAPMGIILGRSDTLVEKRWQDPKKLFDWPRCGGLRFGSVLVNRATDAYKSIQHELVHVLAPRTT